MATAIRNGQEVTLSTTNEEEFEFAALGSDKEYTALIDLPAGNAGTIQFSVGESVAVGQKAVAAGTRIFMTFIPRSRNIRAKASNANDKFSIFV
jgi:hypothetical protein